MALYSNPAKFAEFLGSTTMKFSNPSKSIKRVRTTATWHTTTTKTLLCCWFWAMNILTLYRPPVTDIRNLIVEDIPVQEANYCSIYDGRTTFTGLRPFSSHTSHFTITGPRHDGGFSIISTLQYIHWTVMRL